MLALLLAALSPTHAAVVPANVRQEQVYLDAHASWTLGGEHPFGLGLGGSWRAAPGYDTETFEVGGFVRVDWRFGEGLAAAAGPVVGVAGVDRAPVGYAPYAQVDLQLGVVWAGGFGATANLGVAKSFDPWLLDCYDCGTASPLGARLGLGTLLVPGQDVRPRVELGVQAAMGAREYPL